MDEEIRQQHRLEMLSKYPSVYGSTWEVDGAGPRIGGCYGDLFVYRMVDGVQLVDGATKSFSSVFYTGTISCKLSNRYLHEFLIPNIPDRVKEAIKITRVVGQKYRRAPYLNLREYQRSYNGPNELFPWVRLDVDVNNMTGGDLFILMNFIRMPLYFPRVVLEIFRLHDELKIAPDQAILLGHIIGASDGSHSLITHYSIGDSDDIRADITKWNFKERWEQADKLGPIISRALRKERCSSFFTLGSIKTMAWHTQMQKAAHAKMSNPTDAQWYQNYAYVDILKDEVIQKLVDYYLGKITADETGGYWK